MIETEYTLRISFLSNDKEEVKKLIENLDRIRFKMLHGQETYNLGIFSVESSSIQYKIV